MNSIVSCEHCHGTGVVECKNCSGTAEVICPDCGGSGKSYYVCPECHEGRIPDPRAIDDDETMTCPTCHGEYKKETGACKNCNGTGKVECQQCHGSGKVECQACNATGKFDVDKIVRAAIVSDWYDVEVDKKVKKSALSDEDVTMLRSAAEQGHGGSCYVLGVLKGGDCIGYAEDGDSYFAKGSQAGDADCLYAHAMVLSRREKNTDNLKEMTDCLERSADKENIHAILAFTIKSLQAYLKIGGERESTDSKVNDEKVVQYCARMDSMKVKDGQNQYAIAMANALGKCLPRILNKDSKAMSELASVCLDLHKKTGCEQIKALAEALLDKAAKCGNADAVRQLAESKSESNLAMSLELLDKAAKDGDKQAKEQLQKLMQGCLKEQSRLDELKVFAKTGSVTAMVFLASAYNKGDGVKLSESEAADWMEMAAEAGNGKSMLDVAVKYRNGKGRAKDINKAFIWTYEGFTRGGLRRRALRLFAEFYRFGKFGEPDDNKANELYIRSAKAGYLPAIVEVGRSYLNGWGVKKDLGEAKRLFDLAESKGEESAARQFYRIPDGVKAGQRPISGITESFVKDKGTLPEYIEKDYKKAVARTLWTPEFEAKRKANPVAKREEEEVFGLDRLSQKIKSRKVFVALGIVGGVLGLHLLYVKRMFWFWTYWIVAVLGVLQIEVEAFRSLLAHASPMLAKIPVFAAIAILILVGSICLMKKDGKGLTMK